MCYSIAVEKVITSPDHLHLFWEEAANNCLFLIIMKPYAEKFYSSKAWQRCRRDYKKYAGGLCERCLAKGIIKTGEIVHHRIYINNQNITDPKILLEFDNLELLCRECHQEEHTIKKRRYRVDELGRIAPVGE